MVMKRGCPIVPLHFTEGSQERENQRRTIKTAKTLFKWAPGFPRKVYTVSYEASITKIDKDFPKKLKSVLLRRLTYRVAERLAEMWRAEGIVTGEYIQKSARESLHLFRLFDEAASCFPIYRPLVGLDALEIEELARKIGISEKLSVKGKRHKMQLVQVEKMSLNAVKAAEAKLDICDLVESCLKSLRTVTL
jgi:thiamine biosynthesis protein ThiI